MMRKGEGGPRERPKRGHWRMGSSRGGSEKREGEASQEEERRTTQKTFNFLHA